MKIPVIFLFGFMCLSAQALEHIKETKLLRYPDVHNDRVVFTYSGDLWTASISGGGVVGSDAMGSDATRVTSHPGLEMFPKFSPDGQWIAFTGQYDGDEQVYIVPSTGGAPKRLTAYPAWGPLRDRWGYDNQVVDWTPDSQSVVFRSHREQPSIAYSRLYTVSIDGGLPQALPMQKAGPGVFSPDGNNILFSPEARDFRTWKRYRGGWAKELWIYNVSDQQARNITQYKGTDCDPMWSEKGIAFVSERQGTMNLFALDHDGNHLQQLTQHDKDVRWASGDFAGNIVYDLNGSLRLYDKNGQDRALSIRVADDSVHSRPRTVFIEHFIEHYDLSPNGKRVALTARGDVFSIPTTKGVYLNLTQSDTHDRLATWAPDGKTLAYVSDASGEEEIWQVNAEGGKPQQLTQGNQHRWYSLTWSPTGKALAASDHLGDLYVVDVKQGKLNKVGELGAWYKNTYEWSPDGQYLAYPHQEPSSLHSIFVWSAKNGAVRVTPALSNEFNPMWHPSGDYLYFLADRNFSPLMSEIEWNYAVTRETTVNGLALTKSVPNPFALQNDLAADVAAPEEKTDTPTVTIEFDGIMSRVFKVPLESHNYEYGTIRDNHIYLLASDDGYLGRKPFESQHLIRYSISDQGQQVIEEKVDSVHFVNNHALIQSQEGGFKVYDLTAQTSTQLSFYNLTKQVNPKQEWATVFDEVWRRFRDFFYVRNMHGYDWKAIGEQYRSLVPHVSHRSDLNYLIGEMIGELNVGHAYVYGGDQYLPPRAKPNLLGASFTLDRSSNRYQIDRIFKGDNTINRYRSPLTEVGIDVSEGDYLLAINGIELTGTDNPYELLRQTENPGDMIQLTVSAKPNGKRSRNLLIKPLQSEAPLNYFNWVEANRQQVTKLSEGRLGYLHIPDMASQGIYEFIRAYYGQIRKDGLIVDVRGNLGSNVSQMILERLLRKSYTLGYIEGEKHVRTYPWGYGWPTFTGEIGVLVDETTMSDGEAFSYSFQQSKRGPVVGRRTWGGVVGTDDTGVTVDGGGLKVPQWAMADMDGNWVVEGEGVIPDIEVDNLPTDLMAGDDKQLQVMIDTLLKTLGEKRPGVLPEAAEDPLR